MRVYRCRVCEHPLYAENSRCVSCGSALGFSREERAIVPVDDAGRYVDADGRTWHPCANHDLAACTWLAEAPGALCSCCVLTRTRPADDDAVGLAQLVEAERAKRHLLVELDGLGVDVSGLQFDLLSSVDENVVIGHADGLITIDLAESDDAHRERVRAQLGEPYRTMLGHVRHEVGHFVQWRLVGTEGPTAERCRALFGDERADYQAAIDRHYADGPPSDWAEHHISTYATMHPFEDFAETWAHLLHVVDTVETAREHGLVEGDAAAPVVTTPFRDVVVGTWVPLSIALNQINRSMGKDDLYPFVIPAPVLDKLDFVAGLVVSPPSS
ncbi:putative zinc-binding metallopeptidase [Nocardioides marinquilinus]|uniref:Zinc-binding metallopeptidase n=1 Tax=Nocardioides marinquilinus TaxID=1210400 RepID=A0ABP9PBZ4_9ACTN